MALWQPEWPSAFWMVGSTAWSDLYAFCGEQVAGDRHSHSPEQEGSVHGQSNSMLPLPNKLVMNQLISLIVLKGFNVKQQRSNRLTEQTIGILHSAKFGS